MRMAGDDATDASEACLRDMTRGPTRQRSGRRHGQPSNRSGTGADR